MTESTEQESQQAFSRWDGALSGKLASPSAPHEWLSARAFGRSKIGGCARSAHYAALSNYITRPRIFLSVEIELAFE